MNAVRDEVERKPAFLSHGGQRVLGSLFGSVEMITEQLACAGLPRRPEVSATHSFPPSHLCLWEAQLTSLVGFFSLKFLKGQRTVTYYLTQNRYFI